MSRLLFVISVALLMFAAGNSPASNGKLKTGTADSVQAFARLGNITKDTVSTNEIIANRGLRVILKGYPAGFKVVVLSFSITTVKNMDTIAANIMTTDNFLSTLQIQELRKLNKSGKVIFHSIRATGVSSRIRELPPFSLIIRG